MTERNENFRRTRWERQKREAIKREQVERCYRQHETPQAHELRHHYLGGKGAFNA